MLRSLLIACALVVLAVAVSASEKQEAPKTPPAEYKIPPDAANKPNPVKPTPESLAKGKKIYGYDCAMCHGKNGDGKGEITDYKNMPDFTDPAAQQKRSDGELYYIIDKGKGDMPPEGPRAKPDDLWNLVNYVRTFAKK